MGWLGRSGLATTAALLALTSGASPVTPVSARAGGLEPDAVRVAASCRGGGSMALTLHVPASDGTAAVRVAGSRLVDGSRWRIALADGSIVLRRTAVGGRWVVDTRLHLEQGGGVNAIARLVRGGRSHRSVCFLGTGVDRPFGGDAYCRGGFQNLTVRRRDDDRIVAIYLLQKVPRNKRWHITMQLTGRSSRQVVAFDDRTDLGFLRSRVEFRPSPADPRFRVVSTNERGRHCRLRLNPGQ